MIYWDDEGASCELENLSQGARSSMHELCLESDFVVISRPLNEPIVFMESLKLHKREYLDLWRQF